VRESYRANHIKRSVFTQPGSKAGDRGKYGSASGPLPICDSPLIQSGKLGQGARPICNLSGGRYAEVSPSVSWRYAIADLQMRSVPHGVLRLPETGEI